MVISNNDSLELFLIRASFRNKNLGRHGEGHGERLRDEQRTCHSLFDGHGGFLSIFPHQNKFAFTIIIFSADRPKSWGMLGLGNFWSADMVCIDILAQYIASIKKEILSIQEYPSADLNFKNFPKISPPVIKVCLQLAL